MNKKKRDPTLERKFAEHTAWMIPILIGVLGCILVPTYLKWRENGHRTLAVVQMTEISKALELYKQDNGNYPTTEQGLKALVERPIVQPVPKNWRQYMNKIPKDPWKGDYMYDYLGTGTRYDLRSYGLDGMKSEDDIVNSDKPEE